MVNVKYLFILEQCFKQPKNERKECVNLELNNIKARAEIQEIQAKKGLVWQKYFTVYEAAPSFEFNYFYFDGRIFFDFYSAAFVHVKLPQELVMESPKIPPYISGIEQLCGVAALSLMLIASALIATYKRHKSQTGANAKGLPCPGS